MNNPKDWVPKDVNSIKKVICAGIFYKKLDGGDLADLKEWLIDYLKDDVEGISMGITNAFKNLHYLKEFDK